MADASATESTECPLAPQDQQVNARIYAANVALLYLAAPALYVGFVQAGLCKHLHTTDTVANLPSTAYLVMAWAPVVVAWWWPQVRQLKAVLGGSFALMTAFGLLAAAVLLAGASDRVIISVLVLHGAVMGAACGVVGVLAWEVLSRGVAARLRGRALGLAYGWGPAGSVASSLGAQWLLDGQLFGWVAPPALRLGYPYNYALLFAASAACTALAAYLALRYRIPLPRVDAVRERFGPAVLGGFRTFLRHRVLLLASVAYLLIYCGNMVQTNMTLFTTQAVGRMPEDLVGYQLTLRFSAKILGGFLLGWLLTRTNPKAPLLVTAGLQIAGVVWVLLVPGYWFLLAFAINGAGELFGVYYTNYPVHCSPQADVRRNLAFLSLSSTLVGLAPVVYGWISDTWGLRASFGAALALLVATTALVAARLPANPRPE